MQLLRETIRHLILETGMVTLNKLPHDIGIKVKTSGKNITIEYCERFAKPGEDIIGYSDDELKGPEGIYGIVQLYRLPDRYSCGGTYQVMWSNAKKGYGPLLYDIAMEIATQEGAGLVSDRRSVTDEAWDIWNYYLENRTGENGDVEVFQCDDEDNTLTPDDNDNMGQTIAKGDTKRSPGGWLTSPLSKRFTKEPTTLEKLEMLDPPRIFWE